MRESGKPEDIWDNIISGKMSKKYSEFVLFEQASIFDDSVKVKDALRDTEVSGYVRYAI
jgi:translation elongation factor EF-Ts